MWHGKSRVKIAVKILKLYIKQLCHQQDPPEFPVDIPVFIREVVPPLTAASLVMIAEMVVPQFLSSSTSIPNFAGPQPGTPGGGASPSATPANPTVISGKMYLK